MKTHCFQNKSIYLWYKLKLKQQKNGKMDLQAIAQNLEKLINWESQEIDSYQLEENLLASLEGLEIDDKVQVQVQGETVIVFKAILDSDEQEIRPYYISESYTNIDLDKDDELFTELENQL